MIVNDKIDINNENDEVKAQRIKNTNISETEKEEKERKGVCSNCSIF